MIRPVSRRRIAFSPDALRFLSGIWTGDDTLMMPAFGGEQESFNGQPYARFLTFREHEEEAGRWSIYFEDLFENGGADGDSMSFDSLELAIAHANSVIVSEGFTVFPLADAP